MVTTMYKSVRLLDKCTALPCSELSLPNQQHVLRQRCLRIEGEHSCNLPSALIGFSKYV
jgi:hypothetical protein